MSNGLSARLYKIGKESLPQVATILTFLLFRLAFDGSLFLSAQTPILGCPRAADILALVSTISTVMLVAVVMIVVFLVIFNTIGTVSTIAMRISEFFNERIRFVFELIIVYILFIWGLSSTDIISEVAGCASVNYDALLDRGPLMFRLIGEMLRWLGLRR